MVLDEFFVVVKDKFLASLGHRLIIARRAVARFLDLAAAQKAGLLA